MIYWVVVIQAVDDALRLLDFLSRFMSLMTSPSRLTSKN